MARILTKLRVDEISSVDRGAGEGVKIVLMKRDDGTTPQRPTMRLFNDIMKARDDTDDDDAPSLLLPKLNEMIQAMLTKRKDPPMNRTEELRDIAKANGGMAMIAKNIIDRGSTTITEHEFSEALMAHARLHKRDGESAVSAFSRLLENDIDLRKALGIVKGYPNLMSVEPTQVGGNDAMSVDDPIEAAEQIKALVAEQRARAPTLSVSQVYAAVYADPANKAVVDRAHRRPTA